ncbi:DUF3515 family protein [Streptomyces sp. NPDC047072]|uniref:DUF3515 family protein n=1 Tax=Streptomyces sp. NPDC047072 TaxID=3154809 RepID=UPI0034097C7F
MGIRPLGRRGRVVAGVVVAGLVVGTLLVVREVNSLDFGVRSADRADDPACARIAGGYPSGLGGERRESVSTPGVAVWGGGAVVLRCGLEPPAPTVDACVDVDDVDWVWREKTGADRVLVTYGRNPAVEIRISDRVTAVDDVLVRLSAAVRPIRQTAKCIGEDDVPALR